MQPCMDAASAFTNLSVFATLCSPHLVVSSVRLLLFTCQLSGLSRSVAMYMYVSVSTVSRTLTTPGWRRVRNFRSALRARGSRDLFAVMSKEKMLHLEPSS